MNGFRIFILIASLLDMMSLIAGGCTQERNTSLRKQLIRERRRFKQRNLHGCLSKRTRQVLVLPKLLQHLQRHIPIIDALVDPNVALTQTHRQV